MTTDAEDATQKTTRPEATTDEPASEPTLVVALECDRPRAGSMREALVGVETVTLGRGKARRAERNARTLVIELPDARLSGSHARLVHEDDRWIVEDLGSTNGTYINGVKTKRAALFHRDTVEVGHTLLMYVDAPRPGYADALGRLERVAASRVPILLRGESGTGKEVLAGQVHELSKRPGPFVAVNCGAIVETLVESALFGHAKGAFSGATRDELGFVRRANGGTLFLDEVADLPLQSQAALLRVLQDGQVTPVGTTRAVQTDVRVLSATNRPLDEMIAAGTFRQDLFARLAGFTHVVPPLRDRIEDLGDLVAELLGDSAGSCRFRPDVGRALLRYRWPLNIRELERCLESSRALAADGTVGLGDLPEAIATAARPGAEPRALSEEDAALERELRTQLAASGGNVSAVARELGKARQQIQRWLRRLRIDPTEYRD